MKQSMRDLITGELTLEYFASRFREGWKVASIEWVHESTKLTLPSDSATLLDEQTTLPFGFTISSDGLVQENPLEAAVLLSILDQIVREKRITEIASELNSQGYCTRDGKPWSATAVFNLMPRLVEAGPSLLKSAAWQRRRPSTQPLIEKTN